MRHDGKLRNERTFGSGKLWKKLGSELCVDVSVSSFLSKVFFEQRQKEENDVTSSD